MPITMTNSIGSTSAVEPLFQRIASLEDADAARRREDHREVLHPADHRGRQRAEQDRRAERGPEREPDDAGAQDHRDGGEERGDHPRRCCAGDPTFTPSSDARSALCELARSAMPMLGEAEEREQPDEREQRRDDRDEVVGVEDDRVDLEAEGERRGQV